MRVQLGLCSGTLALILMATAAWGETRLPGPQIDARVSGNTLTIITKDLQEGEAISSPTAA